MTELEIKNLQKGDFVIYRNYMMHHLGHIVELKHEVLEFLEPGNILISAREISNGCAFIYIDHNRLIEKITKKENPEFFL